MFILLACGVIMEVVAILVQQVLQRNMAIASLSCIWVCLIAGALLFHQLNQFCAAILDLEAIWLRELTCFERPIRHFRFLFSNGHRSLLLQAVDFGKGIDPIEDHILEHSGFRDVEVEIGTIDINHRSLIRLSTRPLEPQSVNLGSLELLCII